MTAGLLRSGGKTGGVDIEIILPESTISTHLGRDDFEPFACPESDWSGLHQVCVDLSEGNTGPLRLAIAPSVDRRQRDDGANHPTRHSADDNPWIPRQNPPMSQTQFRFRSIVTKTSIRCAVVGLVSVSALACGYSEDEWQAQLAKYGQLNNDHEATKKELADAQAQVAKLEAQLKKLGFKLTESDADNERLSMALQEYKDRAAALERIKARFETLRKKLEKLTQLGLKIEVRRNRMVISLPGDVLFASGKDDLQDQGKDILRQVAEVIGGDSSLSARQYQVAGHTDSEPLRATKGQFKDNWGLSLMRARSVLLYLVSPPATKGGGGGLTETNWSASGYGSTDPLDSNEMPEGRSKNRRVELIMLPDVEEMLDLKSLI